MKKKRIILSLLMLCFACTTCMFTGCCNKKSEVRTISSESDFVTYFQEGFDRSYKEKHWYGSHNITIESYELTTDITITKTDLKNYTTTKYEQRIQDGESESDFIDNPSRSQKVVVIDGKGHTIKNLTLSGFCASLFGIVTDSNITIKNITFDNLTINSNGPTGAFVSATYTEGCAFNFENVHIINSSITSENNYPIGGFVGNSYRANGLVENCTIENTTINGENSEACGGFIGKDSMTVRGELLNISDCESKNNTISAKSNVGGIYGVVYQEFSDFETDRLINYKNLTNSSSVTATDRRAGGIMGYLSYWDFGNFVFENCHNKYEENLTVEVRAYNSSAGGVLGSANWNGSALRIPDGSQINFNNCTNNMSVRANENAGGISGFIDNRFWRVKFSECKNLSNGSIYGVNKIGGISGSITGSILGGEQFTFTNCENNGFVTGLGEYVGGISAYNDNLNPLFTNCKNSSQNNFLTGVKYVGGISARYGTFVDCENAMDIKHNGDVQLSWTYIGGIVGSGEDSTFTNCTNSGDIIDHTKREGVTATYIGGIAGFTNQLILNGCTNSGTISGNECVGGLVGKSDQKWINGQKNTLINCSNTGNVYAFGQTTTTADNYSNNQVKGKVGLLIGSFHTGSLLFEISNVTATGNIYIVNDTNFVGGWCGYYDCGLVSYDGDVDSLKTATNGSTVTYKIFVSQLVTNVCKENFKYGENVFEGETSGFNNPSTALEDFTYSEE